MTNGELDSVELEKYLSIVNKKKHCNIKIRYYRRPSDGGYEIAMSQEFINDIIALINS